MSLKKQIKKKLIPVACKILLAPKTFSVPDKNIRVIRCDRENAVMMSNTSNNVIRLRVDGKTVYFRECKLRKNIEEYVADEFDYYYGHIHPELLKDKEFIVNALSDKNNLNKFVNMGMTNDVSSGAYQFCMGNGGAYIGLDGMTYEQDERIRELVQFVWGNLFAYTLNNGVENGCYQTYNAVRSIAFSRVSRLLGLCHMIPETEYTLLYIGDEASLFGTVMDSAPGICMEKSAAEERINVCSPELQRELNNLNLLDVLCFEKDHRAGNYNVLIKNGKAVSVCAFDNDSPNSFGMGGISFKTYIGCSPWAVEGKINRPFVDKELAKSVMNLNEKDLCAAVGDLFNAYQIFALKRRLKAIKRILSEVPEEKLLTRNQWNEDTLRTELSGNYGDTYLSKFLQEQQIMHQPWIKEKVLNTVAEDN
ncbi:MAG: hypothetical protein IJE48_08870 [Clostridia bacterium]|nr:hypothetical protein [Clostridia bacterium]